jgi:hypothetical protein
MTADGFRRVLCEVDVRKAELKRERLCDLLFGGEVHPHQHDADTFAGALVLCERDAEIVFADQARLDQALTNLLTHRKTRRDAVHLIRHRLAPPVESRRSRPWESRSSTTPAEISTTVASEPRRRDRRHGRR